MGLSNKKILLSVTGSIAAYKSLVLTRLFIKAGAEVKVVMTPAATKFVSALSFSTLSQNRVATSVIDGDDWDNHVELGLWADVMIVAPCTANTLAKMAHGISDSIVNAVYLSAKCPVMIAPAMDRDMWHHPSTQNNIQTLEAYGNVLIPVGEGFLASGLEGKGRMAEPEDILQFVKNHLSKEQDLSGYKLMITAGPTYETIDPVRFIGNHSSGKMGFALAKMCHERGAKVVLISGPTQQNISAKGIKLIKVKNAEEMYKASLTEYKMCDIAIFAAAVADYTPKRKAKQKIKKQDDSLNIELVRTKDIAGTLGKIKKANQVNIGFALETNKGIESAISKVKRKNFDFIVLNSLKDKGAGFKGDTNKITIIDTTGEKKSFSLKTKDKVAEDIIDYLVQNKL